MKTRVLLVEDDARFAGVVRSVLESDGYDVVDVVDTAEAVNGAVARFGPDVVVLDLVLPDGDGLDAADRLRSDGRDVPVVVFSSLFDQRIARETMASGYGYVEKAAGLEALEMAIDGAVGLAAAVIDLREETVTD